MTEDEAKTKWCPAARVVWPGSDWGSAFSGNRSPLSDDGFNGADRCIASECMAWRWDKGTTYTTDGKAWNRMPSAPAEGRCGLAGKP